MRTLQPAVNVMLFAVVASLTGCDAVDRPRTRSENTSTVDTAALPEPSAHRPNIRGASISLVADRGENDPQPIVLPATPLHLVTDDCTDLVLFRVPDTSSDPEGGIVILNWTEPPDKQRSLTILARSPSCASHEGVRRLLQPND